MSSVEEIGFVIVLMVPGSFCFNNPGRYFICQILDESRSILR